MKRKPGQIDIARRLKVCIHSLADGRHFKTIDSFMRFSHLAVTSSSTSRCMTQQYFIIRPAVPLANLDHLRASRFVLTPGKR